MAETQAWERIVERNRVAETLQRNAYVPSEERLRSVGADIEADKALRRIATLEAHAHPDGLCDDLAQRLAEEHVAKCAAEQRVKELEERCMWAEGTLAGLQAELKGLVDRVAVAPF